MKKMMSVLLAALLAAVLMLPGAAAAEEKELLIVTTIFPVYDWVREVAGTNVKAEIVQLLDNGVDLHSYQPTAEDIRRVTEADLFIYVGGESDEWVEAVADTVAGPDWNALNLMETLGDAVKAEEALEGMEAETHEEEGEEEADEHIWLSLRNAKILTCAIAEALAETDPAHAEAFRKNAEAYGTKLDELDGAYTEAVNQAGGKTLLFCDRYPFRYLADDYGLTCYAAFSGCSAESEASFQTIIFLAQKLDELDLSSVITLENSRAKIADTVINTSKAGNQKILTMDSMQGTTSGDAAAGATYLNIMEKNLEVLREALN